MWQEYVDEVSGSLMYTNTTTNETVGEKPDGGTIVVVEA